MSEHAKKTVFAPATGLIVVASLSIFTLVCSQLFNIWLFASGAIDNLPEPSSLSKETQVIIRMSWNLLMIITSVVILIGAIKMMRLKSQSMARLACILALIPCFGPCFVLGIPFGIWGLVVLKKPGVAESFAT